MMNRWKNIIMSTVDKADIKEIDRRLSFVQHALEHKDLNNAKSIIEELISIAPDDPIVLTIYSEYLYKSNNIIEAYKTINKALQLNPQNPFILKILCKINFNEAKYQDSIKVGETALTLSPKDSPLDIEILYYIGLANYKEENFKEASKYLFAAQRINHTYKDLFYLCSELNVINKLFESYERQKDDHWFLLAAFKTFRKFKHKNHQKKFMTELRAKAPHVLEYDLIKLDLQICKMFDEGASQEEFNKLHSEWIHKNVYAGCVFIFHEMGIVKKDFTHKIIR